MSLAGAMLGTHSMLMRKRIRRDTNNMKSCPNINQWYWLRHIVRVGKDTVMAKAITQKEKREIIGSLVSIDKWLEARFNTKFELPLYGDK
jgi:hypothetical protein